MPYQTSLFLWYSGGHQAEKLVGSKAETALFAVLARAALSSLPLSFWKDGMKGKAAGFAILLLGLTVGIVVGFNLGKTPTASTTTISTSSSDSSDAVSTGDPCGFPSRCTIPFTVSYVHGKANMGTFGIAQVITFSSEKTGTLSSAVNYDPNSQQYREYFLYLPVDVQYQVIIFQDGPRSDTRPACNATPFNFTPIDASDQVQDFVCQ